MYKKIITIGIVSCLTAISAMGQGSAARTLKKAEDNFDIGKLSQISKNLSGYFKSQKTGGFSSEERIQAYRLITLVHLYNDDERKAEKAFIDLLKSDPERPVSSNDPKEFHYLHAKFNIDPIFRLGLKVTVNRTQNNVLSNHAQSTTVGTDSLAVSSKSYTPGIGIGGEFTFEYPLPVKNLELITGFSFSSQKYKVDYIPNENYELSITENQTWMSVPLLLRYSISIGEEKRAIIPYVTLGGLFAYLSNAKLVALRSGGQAQNETVKLGDLRNKINLSILAGVGLKIRSKTNFVNIEIRYVQGLNNLVNPEHRFDDVIRDVARYTDDDFSQNFFSFSIGYIKSYYNPKKYSEKKFNKIMQKKNLNNE